MKKKRIYVVMGSTGEYSDHNEWLVVALEHKKDAQEYVEKAQAKANEWKAMRKNRYTDPPDGWNPYDPGMHMDYTGTNYYVEEVDLIIDVVKNFAMGEYNEK